PSSISSASSRTSIGPSSRSWIRTTAGPKFIRGRARCTGPGARRATPRPCRSRIRSSPRSTRCTSVSYSRATSRGPPRTGRIRTRNAGQAWSPWTQVGGQLYSGNEKEWLRQSIPLTGSAGKDSVQFMIEVADYSQIYCDGVSTPAGTSVYFDNLAVGVVGLAPPTITASEEDLFQDTFQTTPFRSNDNFNTPRGDSVSVRLSASRGLKTASFFYSLNGGSFVNLPLTPYGAAIPTAYSADVPAGA